MEQQPNILIIDAQGGGIGRLLASSIRQELPDVPITAVGGNTAATAAMLKAGADRGATGENAAVVACRTADVILGPIGIVIADSMLGEITPKMAAAVAQSGAKRILIPFEHCDNIVVGVREVGMKALVKEAVSVLAGIVKAGSCESPDPS